MNRMGHLTVLLGCMFAQKTTELLRRIRRSKAIGQKVLVINYIGDTRYGSHQIVSHDIDRCDALCVKGLVEADALVRSGEHRLVVIDEGQFYNDLLPVVKQWADELPINLVVAGLDGDSNRNPFGDMLRLLPLAEEVVRLSALCGICKNGTEAHFTKAIAPKDKQVVIGSGDLYVPVCREHYLKSV